MVSNQPLALAPVTGTKGFISNIHRPKTGLVSFPDPPPKRKGGSGEYCISSHYGLAAAMDTKKLSLQSLLLGFSTLEGVLSRSVKCDE